MLRRSQKESFPCSKSWADDQLVGCTESCSSSDFIEYLVVEPLAVHNLKQDQQAYRDVKLLGYAVGRGRRRAEVCQRVLSSCNFTHHYKHLPARIIILIIIRVVMVMVSWEAQSAFIEYSQLIIIIVLFDSKSGLVVCDSKARVCSEWKWTCWCSVVCVYTVVRWHGVNLRLI